MDTPIVERSAVDLAEAIRKGELSSVEVVSAHLDQIERVNPAVNALVSMRGSDEILADAAVADEVVPERRGRLHGLPVAVKDLEDVAGLPTSHGSVIASDAPVAADGHIAAKLRSAGAIIVGKTNTPEFGTGSHTFNEVFGMTRNPWNLGVTAGGSSGGAAAALAARMLPIADGSDLGGSLRNPAGMCNVVGLRPSIGRVAVPHADSTHLRLAVSGPMGRSVADAGLVLSALAGRDSRDPWSLPDDPATFADPLATSNSARLAWGGDLGMFECDPEVLAICANAAERITDVGGSLYADQPRLEHAENVFRVLRGVGYRKNAALLPDDAIPRLKETVRENIAYGRSLTLDDVVEAERQRADLHRTMSAFFDDYDVLALPTCQVAAFPVETEYPTSVNGVDMADYLGWMMACCVITPTGCPAISIPAGFTDDGRPVGLQLVARFGHDRQLLEIAAAIEASNPLGQLVPDVAR